MKTLEYYVNNLKVLYEDNHLLVVEKFQNVLSQKDITNDIDMTDIVGEYLKIKYNKPNKAYVGLIHRLDRRVGGVMVFCKTSKAAARLSEAIRLKKFDKYYLCLVKGNIDTSGTYVDKLIKDEKKHIARVSSNGKEAILNYKVIKRFEYNNEPHSALEVELITGRFNQIRCQMAHHHHPLVNDYKYGYPSKEDQIGLYCYKVGFNHPITKEYMVFELMPKGGIWNYV